MVQALIARCAAFGSWSGLRVLAGPAASHPPERRAIMRPSFAIAVTAGLVLGQPAFGHDDRKLGKVHFETSCKPEAQKHFDRAMLYQHSFWYRASQQAFEHVLQSDPECGIAYWGIALSLLWNPHVPTPAKNLAEGAAAVAKAKNAGARSQRE